MFRIDSNTLSFTFENLQEIHLHKNPYLIITSNVNSLIIFSDTEPPTKTISFLYTIFLKGNELNVLFLTYLFSTHPFFQFFSLVESFLKSHNLSCSVFHMLSHFKHDMVDYIQELRGKLAVILTSVLA